MGQYPAGTGRLRRHDTAALAPEVENNAPDKLHLGMVKQPALVGYDEYNDRTPDDGNDESNFAMIVPKQPALVGYSSRAA